MKTLARACPSRGNCTDIPAEEVTPKTLGDTALAPPRPTPMPSWWLFFDLSPYLDMDLQCLILFVCGVAIADNITAAGEELRIDHSMLIQASLLFMIPLCPQAGSPVSGLSLSCGTGAPSHALGAFFVNGNECQTTEKMALWYNSWHSLISNF